MLEMHTLRPEERPQATALWQMVFGDEKALIDAFLDQYSTPGDLFVLTDGDETKEVMTLLALLPLTFRWADGREEPLPYVYALATRPHRRGKGYARLLLRYAAYQASMRWARGIATVPAEASLHNYFATEGYLECFTTRTGTVETAGLPAPDPEDALLSAAPAEYNALREKLLAGTNHAAYPDALIAFQQLLCQGSGGGLFTFTVNGRPGCAALEKAGEDRILLKELLAPDGAETAALTLLAASCPAKTYQFRTPLGAGSPGTSLPFGMAKHLGEGKRPPFAPEGCYLGLAFD